MFGSQTAESSMCTENLTPWKLLKLPDIPVLWGVCPPTALLVFPQSPVQGMQSPCKVVSAFMTKSFQKCWKCFYLTGGAHYRDDGSSSVPFSGCSECSSWQFPPPQPPHLWAFLGRLTSCSPWLRLLHQLPSHLANWVLLLRVVQPRYTQIPFRRTSSSRGVPQGTVPGLTLF